MVAVSTSSRAANRRLALILVAAISVLWGLNWPAMKLLVGQLSPWTFRVLCVYGAGVTLLLTASIGGEKTLPDKRDWWPILLVATFGVTGWHMLTAFGLGYIGGGRGAIVAFTMPIWAMILSVLFLGEKFTAKGLVALACGMTGIGLLLVDSFGQLGDAPLGTLLIAIAALSWGCSTVGTKAFSWTIGTVALSGWLLVIGGIPIAAVWLATEAPGNYDNFTWTGAFALFYVTFVALVFCFTSYLRIVRLLPASVAAISTLAIPVVGVLSSAMLLGEKVGGAEVLALALVLVALVLVLWPAKRKAV